MKSTILVNLRIDSALKTYLFVIWYYTKQGALNSCQNSALWCHFPNKLYCTTSKCPAKIRIVSTFIRIKPKNVGRKQLYFLWVEFFLKMHIVMIFMFLHSSSPSSSTKSTLLKSDFKKAHL